MYESSGNRPYDVLALVASAMRVRFGKHIPPYSVTVNITRCGTEDEVSVAIGVQDDLGNETKTVVIFKDFPVTLSRAFEALDELEG